VAHVAWGERAGRYRSPGAADHVGASGGEQYHVPAFVAVRVPLAVELQLELSVVDDVQRSALVAEGDGERGDRCAAVDVLTAQAHVPEHPREQIGTGSLVPVRCRMAGLSWTICKEVRCFSHRT